MSRGRPTNRNLDDYYIVKPRNPNCGTCGKKKTIKNTYLRTRKDPDKLYFNAYCIKCSTDIAIEWKEDNREQWTENMRKYISRWREEINKKSRDRRRKGGYQKKECKHCGNTIDKPTSGTQKYHPECKKIVRREQKRNNYYKNKK